MRLLDAGTTTRGPRSVTNYRVDGTARYRTEILVPGHADIPLLSPLRTPAGMEEWRNVEMWRKAKDTTQYPMITFYTLSLLLCVPLLMCGICCNSADYKMYDATGNKAFQNIC